MVINLRPPSGPGLPLPSLDEPWKRTSFFNEPNLRKILDSPYHGDVIARATGRQALGTIEGGPTLLQAYDILRPDPRKWSTIEPPKSLAAPMLADFGAKASSKDPAAKLGNFNLNLIQPFDSLRDAFTEGAGAPQPQQAPGEVVFGDLKVNPMDVLAWQGELPVKLMERPLALLQTVANRLIGTPMALDTGGDAVYPFQKDPAYWAWLRTATEEQISQFARAQAGQYASPGRNSVLFDALLDRFRQDQRSITGLSSGDASIDYGAKRRAFNASGQPYANGEYALGADQLPGLFGLRPAFANVIGAVPFIGINLIDATMPLEPEVEAYWQGLSAAERQKFLEQQSYVTVGKNLVGMLFGFSGVSAIAGAAKASSIPTVAAMGRAWSTTLNAANVLMASGLTISLVSWAAEASTDTAIAEFGRDVNMGAPISHSQLAAVLNNVGMFASGSFGAGLALRAGARVGGAAARAVGRAAGLSESIWGTRELPFFTEGFGGSAHRAALYEAVPDLAPNMADLSMKQALMSYLINASEADRLAVNKALREGLGTVPELDALPAAEREAWISEQLGRSYSSRQARVAQMVDRLDRYRQSLPLLPTTDDVAASAATRLGVRNLIDTATHQFVTQYGPRFFGSTLAEIRSSVEQGLRAMDKTPDMAKLDARLGKHDNPRTVEAWRKMARLVHQMGYVHRNGELAAAVKAHPVSAEKGLALLSQRTPFKDEMEAALPILRGEAGEARALARRLIAEKLRLDELYALGHFRDREQVVADPDPVSLASYIEEVLQQDGFPARRINASRVDPTFELPLNQFHAKIADEGKWELGFREGKPFARGETLSAYLEQELSPFEFAMYEPQRVTMVDVVPDGYVELKPGQRYKRVNWYELDPIQTHDGKMFARDDGTLGSGVPAPPAPISRPTNDPLSPEPFDPYAGTKAAEAFDLLPERQQVLVRDVNRSGGTYAKAPAAFDLVETGQVMRGRNAGAEWPVLQHGITGDKYLFKARRGDAGLSDLSPARRLAGPTATKLFAYFGLHTAEEIPYTWGGTKGTLQKLLDVQDVVDLNRPGAYTSEVRAELVKHHVVDWLTGQHDSNSDSFLIADDGHVYGVDKGQAYKYLAEPESQQALTDGAEFWDFRTRDALDTHLGEYIGQAIGDGKMELSWNDVEPLLREIEALPEDVYLAALKPLAEARVADGRFEPNVETFYEAAIARKRSMRSAVKNAYQHFDYATLPGEDGLPFWVPGRKGLLDLRSDTPVQLNERPIPLEDLYARNDAAPVPEPDPPATTDHYKAGVVVRETDGRLWAIAPKNGFGGYSYTWPKGKVEAGESFQHAAIREAFEETGLSVNIEGHLIDLPNDAGNVTRYYLARRVSGGPEHIVTAHEIEGVALMKEAEAGNLLFRNGAPDPRDNAVLDALRDYRSSSRQAAAAAPSEAGPTGAAEVTVAEPAEEMGYVSHVRLRNGEVWETPWLDPATLDPGQINLGNRGIAGRAFDGVFHGWRAWRIAETQKAGLHHALTRDYAITPAQVEEFHSGMLALSRKYRGVSMQVLAGTPEEFPVLGRMAEEVRELGARIFGEGPFLNRRTGRADVIDFNREAVKAYRQGLRLNVLAGLTSYLKAMPGVGALVLPITDVVYPLFRYVLSFIFKPSEIAESAPLNAMRGVVRSGDPFIDALYYRAGMGSGLGVLAEERGYDLQLQGVSAFNPTLSGEAALTATGTMGQRAKFGEDPFFYEALDPRTLAKKIATEVAPREAAPDAVGPPRSSLADSLGGDGLQLADPVRYPDTYPDQVRHLLDQIGVDDATGAPILQVSGGEKTQRQVLAKRDQIYAEILQSIVADPDAAARYGAAFTVLRNLPPGTIERLAEAIPLMHTPVTRAGSPTLTRQIGFIEDAIKAGNPLFPGMVSTGKYELALYESLTGATVPQAERVVHDVSSSTISHPEQWVGFADAKYGSMAAAYQEGGRADKGLLVMLKPEAMKESVTLDTDRINYANDVQGIKDAMMTPAAVNAITRLVAQRMLIDWAAGHSEMTLMEFMVDRSTSYFGAISPFEFAFLKGLDSADIASLLVPSSGLDKWGKLVAKHADHPTLADVPVVPFDESIGYLQAMWANAMERAGLLDLAKSRPEDWGMPGPDDAVLGLPLEAIQRVLGNPNKANFLVQRIEEAAGRAGLRADVVMSHADRLAQALLEERIDLRREQGNLERSGATPRHEAGNFYFKNPADAQRAIDASTARIARLEELQRELEEFNRTGGYASHDEAMAASQSSDPTVAARARNWLDTEGALTTRMASLNIHPGEGPVAGSIRVIDTKTAEVLLDRPTKLDAISIAPATNTESVRAEFPWDMDKARALIEAHMQRAPLGYGLEAEGFLPRETTAGILEQVNTPEFRTALRSRAEAKLGTPLNDPVIRAYVRGPAHRLAPENPAPPGVDELVIIVQDGSGAPYGNLTMPEINELWQQYGLPKAFNERAAASQYSLRDAAVMQTPHGENAGFLFHGDGPTPGGRAHVYLPERYGALTSFGGDFAPGPLGKRYVDSSAPAALDISFAHHFEPAGRSYVDLETGHVLWRSSVVREVHGDAATISRQNRRGEHDWTYDVGPATDGIQEARILDVDRWGQKIGEVQLRMQAIRDLAGRGDEYAAGGVRLKLLHADDRLAFDRLALKGEIPDWLVAVDNMGKVVDKPAIVRELNPATETIPMEPPPATFTTPEVRFSERLQAELELLGAKGRRAVKALFIDPLPYKQRAMDKLGFKLIRERFAPLLKVEAPHIAAVFSEMKIPEGRWMDFLLYDRHLLDRWLRTKARADFEALIEHAGTYTGKADYAATRQSLDELYTSPGFDTLLETLRLGMKAAQDEAYQVHFFTPYRSTFERSINHPLLGIYPASWAYKAAKEWIRFLYQNQTLGFRAGMVPAQVIRQIADAQAVAFAQQSDQSLAEWYEKGPYRNSIFIFNLLMPGDWSSLPFPASRTIRDLARGNANLFDIFERNIASIGLGRDIRLTTGAGAEILDTITGKIGEGRAFKKAGVSSSPGWSLAGDDQLPVQNPADPPREIFNWH